tara:strand:+ start:1161 stop:2060 length:900 start_codon:yes stop_codon:yes gene_type:complete
VNTQHTEKANIGWSIEITPKQGLKIENFAKHLPINTTVNVTCLPGTSPNDTIQTAEKLKNSGMNPVPHIAARSLADLEELDYLLQKLVKKASVSEVLVIGGGGKKQLGQFSDSLSVLKSGLLQKHGITKIGVAGHPEGSADISEEQLKTALLEKNELAKVEGLNMYVETQFCFDHEVILKWESLIRDEGNKLPIHVGIPGPATIKELFRFARLSGIGNSMSFLTKQARNVTKLLTIQSPDDLLLGLTKGIENDRGCLIDNFHFYPFGGFVETATYVQSFFSKYNSSNFYEQDKNNKLVS